MNKVYQEIIDPDNGDCMRAVVATLLNKKLHDVPHFLEHGDKWFSCMWKYMVKEIHGGYSMLHNRNYSTLCTDQKHYCFTEQKWHYPSVMTKNKLHKYEGINGLFFGSVLSPNYFNLEEGFMKTHAVVIDQDYNIVHDPNPGYKDVLQYPLSSLLGYNGIIDVLLFEPTKIDWEFDRWMEKKESLAVLKGYDKYNSEYEATGIMASMSDILEVRDIEVVKEEKVD